MSLLETLSSARGQAAQQREDAAGAILRTVAYSAVFDAPLPFDDLHRGLMDVALSRRDLEEWLGEPAVRRCVAVTDGLVYPRGRSAWLDVRRQRQEHTGSLLRRHRFALKCLSRFPFVRLLALSGACAHGNASDEDVDVFLIVKKNRAWAVCLALMVASKALGLRRSLCINYIVDEEGMRLPEADLFTASEIVGMKVLAGPAAYEGFLWANDWVGRRFPNFWLRRREQSAPEAGPPVWLEALLDLGPAPLLEAFSRRVLGAYLRRKGRGRPGVTLSPHRLKLHMEDHRPRLGAAYDAVLREMEIEAPKGALTP